MAKPDFMTDYQRGNAYVWGRISGESQTLRSGIGATIKHGSLYKKFEGDKNFQKLIYYPFLEWLKNYLL